MDLVCDAAIASLVETLRLVATAASSRQKGEGFYQEMVEFMDRDLREWGMGNE